MNKIDLLFETKKENILSVYFTAGYPKLNDTGLILETLENSEVDLIEIGLPFSDPLADGEKIQRSSKIALENGMNINLLFQQLAEIKPKINKPLIIMTYFNPVFVFGIEHFLKLCEENNISGLIIPDLPPEEYENNYQPVFEKHHQHLIQLITPHSSESRIKKLTQLSKGFTYLVSDNSITGNKFSEETVLKKYVQQVKSITTQPLLIGFGINTPEKFESVCKLVNGGIIGSAFIDVMSQKGSLTKNINEFIQHIKSTVNDYTVN